MGGSLLEFLLDGSFNDRARIVGAWIVANAGEDGWVEVGQDERAAISAALHNRPTDRTIMLELGRLSRSPWFERRAGGRGHGDAFRATFLGHALQRDLTDRSQSSPRPNERTHAPGVQPKAFTSQSSPQPIRPVVEEEVVGSREERDAREISTEIGEELAGCRDALRDYLLARVDPERHHGYVMSVRSWLDGLGNVFRLPSGGTLPAADRPGFIVLALNELLASDESKMRRPVGDTGNLRTKLDIVIRQANTTRSGSTLKATGTDGPTPNVPPTEKF